MYVHFINIASGYASKIHCGTTRYLSEEKEGKYMAGTMITWNAASGYELCEETWNATTGYELSEKTWNVTSGYELCENYTTAVCQCNGTWSKPTPCCKFTSCLHGQQSLCNFNILFI